MSPQEGGQEEYDVSDRAEERTKPYFWMGTTYFREVRGAEDEMVDDWRSWGPQISQGLIRGVGTPGAPKLVKDLSVVGIERTLLILSLIHI